MAGRVKDFQAAADVVLV
jgi:hypothetical protein